MNKLVFLVACVAFLHGSAKASEGFYELKQVSPNSLVLINNNQVAELKFPHSIEGYVVNCKRTAMFVWGGAMSIDAPQASKWSLVSVNSAKRIKTKSEGFGIFQIRFLKDGRYAQVEYSRGEYLVSVKSGQIKIVDKEYAKEEFEDCDSTSTWIRDF